MAETWCGEKGKRGSSLSSPGSATAPRQQSHSPAEVESVHTHLKDGFPVAQHSVNHGAFWEILSPSRAPGSTSSPYPPAPALAWPHPWCPPSTRSPRPPSLEVGVSEGLLHFFHPAAAPCRAAGWWSSGPDALGRPSSPAGTRLSIVLGLVDGERANRAEGGRA